MPLPVILRQKAESDADEIVAYYAVEAGGEVASQFIDALEETTIQLSRHPLVGSLRYSYELDLPELRAWPIQRFPYVIFYVTGPESIDVWRILHSKRDMPVWLEAPDSPQV